MEEFVVKNGKKLRLGYTTGSCAAAAAKAAAWMLLTGTRKERITLQTPGGTVLELAVEQIRTEEAAVSCAIRKDSGDDPDVTNGTYICAAVSRRDAPGVVIDGGQGVGRVTRQGLDQPVGAAAINSVPRRMIRENVEEVMELTGYTGGLTVIISAPEGEALAKRTFNPRLGIEGGISILGTTGIVEPMSEKALVDTIRVELRQRRALGREYALLVPGNYGVEFLHTGLGVDPAPAVQTSNFIGETVDACRELGFAKILLVGHIGKLVKLAGGMMNTHSRYGDCRMEILAAHAAACGADAAAVRRILECVTCDDALRLLQEAGGDLCAAALRSLTEKIIFHLTRRAGDGMPVETILFSRVYGLLEATPGARELLHTITEG